MDDGQPLEELALTREESTVLQSSRNPHIIITPPPPDDVKFDGSPGLLSTNYSARVYLVGIA